MSDKREFQNLMIHLAAARANLDSAIIALEEIIEPKDYCDHPEGRRTDMSTMGFKRWICDDKKGGCGYQFEMPISEYRKRQKEGGTSNGEQSNP